jgi:hypothetical protein
MFQGKRTGSAWHTAGAQFMSAVLIIPANMEQSSLLISRQSLLPFTPNLFYFRFGFVSFVDVVVQGRVLLCRPGWPPTCDPLSPE